MGTCEELSKDRKTIDKLAENYWTLEKSATPVAMLLPWFRGAAKKAQETSSLALYNLINHFVQLRRKASALTSDPIDSLIRDGNSDDAIISVSIYVIINAWRLSSVDSSRDLVRGRLQHRSERYVL